MTYIEKAKTHPDFMGGNWKYGANSTYSTFTVQDTHYGSDDPKNISIVLMQCFMFYTVREVTQEFHYAHELSQMSSNFWNALKKWK